MEFDSNGIIHDVSQQLLDMQGGKPKEAVLGSSFDEAYSGEGGAEKGALIWKKLKNGEQVTDFVRLGDTSLRLEFVPILDKTKNCKRLYQCP